MAIIYSRRKRAEQSTLSTQQPTIDSNQIGIPILLSFFMKKNEQMNKLNIC